MRPSKFPRSILHILQDNVLVDTIYFVGLFTKIEGVLI